MPEPDHITPLQSNPHLRLGSVAEMEEVINRLGRWATGIYSNDGFHRSARTGYMCPDVGDTLARLVADDLEARNVCAFRLVAYDNSSAVFTAALIREWYARGLDVSAITYYSISKHADAEDNRDSMLKHRDYVGWETMLDDMSRAELPTVFIDDDICTGRGVGTWVEATGETFADHMLFYCIRSVVHVYADVWDGCDGDVSPRQLQDLTIVPFEETLHTALQEETVQ